MCNMPALLPTYLPNITLIPFAGGMMSHTEGPACYSAP